MNQIKTILSITIPEILAICILKFFYFYISTHIFSFEKIFWIVMHKTCLNIIIVIKILSYLYQIIFYKTITLNKLIYLQKIFFKSKKIKIIKNYN